ncbi:hypothetical protein CTheo_4167 [Ceratobasidium theobromae]|uniref:BTB domain-containing protein n=1 Tax=Ceratobasidium theobromae TaxID=1582974 RepID=A0A5N5QLF3_9AGAM|nr:hypothetical protein CTheo_4167 [Ceratobasidium theobromae]
MSFDHFTKLDVKPILELENQTCKAPIIPECNGEPVFEPGDGDLELWVNGTCFETHKFLIKRFDGLKHHLHNQFSKAVLRLQREQDGADDFRRTFRVVYAMIVDGPIAFDTRTLISALRIATAYDYPKLRAYVLKCLERCKLPAIERIKLAREFNITPWEGPAFIELCKREEALTIQEAGILGLETLVHVAHIREQEHREDASRKRPKLEHPIFPVDAGSKDAPALGRVSNRKRASVSFRAADTTPFPFAFGDSATPTRGLKGTGPLIFNAPKSSRESRKHAPGTTTRETRANHHTNLNACGNDFPRSGIIPASATETAPGPTPTVPEFYMTDMAGPGSTFPPFAPTLRCQLDRDLDPSAQEQWVLHQSISSMTEYANFSHEELRAIYWTRLQSAGAPDDLTTEQQVHQMLGVLKYHRKECH